MRRTAGDKHRQAAGPNTLTRSGRLAPLLAPGKLIPASVIQDRTLIPDVAGIYGWWFDTPPPGVPLEGTLAVGKHHLLYVGIAPRMPSASGSLSKSTLRKRITRNHLGNRIGSSTLRRSLAALLRDGLLLHAEERNRKPIMSSEHEGKLSQWMREHAAVSFMSCQGAWHLEDQLVSSSWLALPLNIRGAGHQFVEALAKLRSKGQQLQCTPERWTPDVALDRACSPDQAPDR